MRINGIIPVALLGALCCASLRAQVYTEHSGPNTSYLNCALPPGYYLLTRDVLGTNVSNKGLETVAEIVKPPNCSAPKNGFTVFTMDENGFKADNYLNGWADPRMTLSPANVWLVKNPYDLMDHPPINTGATNSSAAAFAVGAAQVIQEGLASVVFCPTGEGDVVGDYWFRRHYTFTNNQWLPHRPTFAIGESFHVAQEYMADQYTNQIWMNQHLRIGQVNFFTFNATNVEFGQVMDARGQPLSVNGLGQLYAGTNVNENQFVPVGTPVGFSTNPPGYIASGVVSIPFVVGGQSVCVQLRAWLQADGPSYAAASARNAPVGKSSAMALTAHAKTEGWVSATSGNVRPGNPPLDVNVFPSFRLEAAAAPPQGVLPDKGKPE